MNDNLGHEDGLSDGEWQRASPCPTSGSSQTTASSVRLTQGIEELCLEREWNVLSRGSATPSKCSEASNDPSSSSSAAAAAKTLDLPEDGIMTAEIMEDWRRIIKIGTPGTTESESEGSELSVLSSNAFDPAFFPERNATPTNNRPQRGCSVRHEVRCQLCSEEIRGMRWMCKECPQWNVCNECFIVTAELEVHPVHTFIRIYSPTDIFKIQEQPKIEVGRFGTRTDLVNSVVSQPVIHFDVQCHNCDGSIIGNRFDCSLVGCSSISFCQDCEALPINCHPPSHPLIKYKLTKEFSVQNFSLATPKPELKEVTPPIKKSGFTFSDNPPIGGGRSYQKDSFQLSQIDKLSKATLPSIEDFYVKKQKSFDIEPDWMMETELQQLRKRRLYEDDDDGQSFWNAQENSHAEKRQMYHQDGRHDVT